MSKREKLFSVKFRDWLRLECARQSDELDKIIKKIDHDMKSNTSL